MLYNHALALYGKECLDQTIKITDIKMWEENMHAGGKVSITGAAVVENVPREETQSCGKDSTSPEIAVVLPGSG
ncbi:MAG: hypothetical protein AB1546_10210 [bacterium]